MNIKVAGNAVVIVSSLDFDDIVAAKKLNKDILTHTDKDKKPIFKIDVGSTGSVEDSCIRFNSKEEGKASVTMVMPTDVEGDDRIAWIKDNCGKALVGLKAAEKAVASELKKVTDAIDAVTGNIEVV